MDNTLTVGALVTVRGVKCEVVNILPAGTVEVVALGGSRAWRVSGLALIMSGGDR